MHLLFLLSGLFLLILCPIHGLPVLGDRKGVKHNRRTPAFGKRQWEPTNQMIETEYPKYVLAKEPSDDDTRTTNTEPPSNGDGTQGTSIVEPKTPDGANQNNPTFSSSTSKSPILLPLAPFSFTKPLDQQLRDYYSNSAGYLNVIPWNIDTPASEQIYTNFVYDRTSKNPDGTRNILWNIDTPIDQQNEYNNARWLQDQHNKPSNTKNSPDNLPGTPGNIPDPPVENTQPTDKLPEKSPGSPGIPPNSPDLTIDNENGGAGSSF
ncbi:hypothetical protein MMC07_001514 [Pseudocyphellaria aurata]|nr:hypothetical protein [Pseudocyphellaria aurata]